MQSRLALNNIEKATRSLDSLSMKLISRLTNYVIAPNSTEQALLDLLSKNISGAAQLKGTEDLPNNPTTAQLNQLRVDNLIAAFYYASVSNVGLQLNLPPDMSHLTSSGVVNLIDQSKRDAVTLKGWILESQALLDSSNLKHLYEEALTLENNLRTVTEFYAGVGARVPDQPDAAPSDSSPDNTNA
jgi:hypothetical protein